MIKELRQFEEQGYVRSSAHATLDLLVWNYTPTCQYEEMWEQYPLLKKCRGLVTDHAGNIVAHPLEKFKNWEQHRLDELPDGQSPIEVTEKMDGSLLIVYRYQDQVVYNTRGSFNSDQAIAGAALFKKKYDESWIQPGLTYLFEYIAPENRIVVVYPEPNLVHIALLQTSNGKDMPRDDRFEPVSVYSFNDGLFSDNLYYTLRKYQENNKEGYVIRVLGNNKGQDFRIKVKFDEYCRLHSIITHCSNIQVWENLSKGEDLAALLKDMPDEFYKFVTNVKMQLEEQYKDVEHSAMELYEQVKNYETRKEQAQYVLNNDNHKIYAPIVFKMLNEQPYNELIWKFIKPATRLCPFGGMG